jgi:ABC-2 type transport system ATP-binding protein
VDSTIFLSSHDLAEMDGFATHVMFLDSGRIQLCEEMSSLAARFREVTVTLAAPVPVPANLPPTWIQVSANDSSVRLVDSAFDVEGTPAEISRRFGSVQNSTFAPMTLRAIFLALGKNGKKSP